MRLFLIANLLILSVGIGYSFRITEFLDPLFRKLNSNHPERQSEDNEIEDEILPLFLVTFAATTLWNLVTMGGGEAAIDCDGKNHISTLGYGIFHLNIQYFKTYKTTTVILKMGGFHF